MPPSAEHLVPNILWLPPSFPHSIADEVEHQIFAFTFVARCHRTKSMKKWVFVGLQYVTIYKEIHEYVFISCPYKMCFPWWRISPSLKCGICPILGRGRCHTLPCGLQTFNTAETNTKVRLPVSNDPLKSHRYYKHTL
jgi:hypothetical protein